jgi:CheY-like chemotaxis protein
VVEGTCILVAEDDPAVREVLRDVIEAEGYAVTQARDGVEALIVAHARRPDLIIIDLNMPRLGGEAFCHAYRERGGSAPVVLITAASQEAIEACGAVGYIPKPFDIDDVLDLIARYLPLDADDDRVRA